MKDDKINISELAQTIAEATGRKKEDVNSFIKNLFILIEEGLRADKVVKVSGLGTFKLQWNEPRKSVDVNTGNEIVIEGYNKVVFAPEAFLKEKINEPFAHLEAVEISETGAPVEKPGDFVPLQKLDEQAAEIKDLLADINDMQEAEEVPEKELETAPAAEIENTTNTNEAMKEEPTHEAAQPEAQPAQVAPEEKVILAPEEKAETKAEVKTPEPKPTTAKTAKPTTAQPKKNGWKIVGMVLACVIVLLIALYFVLQNKIEQWAKGQLKKQPTEQIVEQEIITEEPQLSIFEQPRTYTEFIGTEELTPGSRLAWLSTKYYGSPYFWVYIYEANMDVIPNPNHITIGTTIKIPKMQEELINADDPDALGYARKLHEQYVQ